MASVFLSYDRDDTARARPIALALEKAGHSVWWDLHVRGGAQFGKVIEEALKAADAVVVLWSKYSVESAWVKDEAAAGRDSGRLVPVTLDGTEPPLGFRQFQTIDLSGWRGRGKARLQPLLDSVATNASPTAQAPQKAESVAGTEKRGWAPLILAAGAVALLFGSGGALWMWNGRAHLPVVEVAAANASPRSQAAASDLFVKLGSLAQIGQGKWQLVDSSSASARSDLVFRTADVGSPQQPKANLVLLDGNDKDLLWSREFSFPAGGEADLRQQMSLTAGRVLGCALEAREAGGLRRDLLKLFLNACALLAETSVDEPEKVSGLLRTIVEAAPEFLPGWSRLLSADMGVVDIAKSDMTDIGAAMSTLRADSAKARRVDPNLPELAIVESRSLPPTAYEKTLQLLAQAAVRAPDSPEVYADQSFTFQRVGRMQDAVNSARRAAELDPLSPTATTQLIMTLAYAGRLDEARKELARAERLWAGTGALRDAIWAFHLRFGDPIVAKRYARANDDGLDIYLNARANPSPANSEKLAAHIRQFESKSITPGMLGWAIQSLGEINRNEELLGRLTRSPTETVATNGYLLFRPALDSAAIHDSCG